MFNLSARREAIESFENAVSRHNAMCTRVTDASRCLFERRAQGAGAVVVP